MHRSRSHTSTAGERRVAITTTPAAYGGLEKVTAELVGGLHARGRSVVLAVVLEPSSEEPAWVIDLRHQSVEVVVIRVSGRDYLGEYREIQKLIVRWNIAVVHTHGYRADLIHASAARALGIPTLSTVHGFTGRGIKGKLYDWLQCRALRAFDWVVAVSRPLADGLLAKGVQESRVRIIPNGMPIRGVIRDRAAARETLGLGTSRTVVGWVGRVSSEKGPDLVIRAMQHLPQDVTLCMVGDGPDLATVRALAETLGVSGNVRFTGALADVSALFRAFDVLALSSRTEGTPMVILEAAAAGVPVVATAVGGVPDLLGAEGGWLVPAENPAALASGIQEVLRNPEVSASRASALLSRLNTRTESEDWIAQYDALYSSLNVR